MHIGRLTSSLVSVCLCSSTVQAQWTQRQSQNEPSTLPSVVHQHVVFANPASGAEATLDLAKFSPKSCQVQIIDNPNGDRDLATAVKAANSVAGVNGGYFDENFASLGLRIIDGKTVRPLVQGRLLTGVFIFLDAQARIVRRSEFSRRDRPTAALQCGPFLLDRGRAVPGLNSSQRARRTFVATTTAGQVALGASSSLSLRELAEVLATKTGDLKNERALNLDGGSSTAFWFKREDGSVFSIPGQKPVRDFIGVSAK